uniref:Integrase catalytic domain-containing protein n=1 Tax=Anopheles dirus TaxID=7168 RepID=A0A182ND84_9DIPT
MHGGITLTLSTTREEFWPLNGRRAVRSAIRSCYRCNRADPTPVQQPIATVITRYYCGPILLKPAHRKAAAQKAYICIFVCMSTKAVHLELVCDLSTASFLKALDRFIWRRNKPQHIYSDNGTNFIGAKNALHHIYRMLTKEPDRSTVYNYLAEDGIQWHLIPPRAPNFGGLWEAAVKVAKKHLVKQLGSAMLSYEDMATALTRIEGCMNSRPLTPLSNDPNDLSPLTPAHLL